MTYQGYKCVKKFSERPQSVEISYQNFSHFRLPSFTFCPNLQTECYDNQALRDCNLTIDEYLFDGPWVGPDKNCSNPKELYLKLIPSVNDLMEELIQEIGLMTMSMKYYNLRANRSLVKWSKINHFQYPCHTMTLNEGTAPQEGIKMIRLHIFNKVSSPKYTVYIHHPGTFMKCSLFPSLYSDYCESVEMKGNTKYSMDLEVMNFLTFDGEACSKEVFDECFNEAQYKVPF